jgi:hypothetical protein
LTPALFGDESGYAVPVAGVAVATLVVLACRLSCDTEPVGDLWPSDALIDGVVNERREFRLCLVPRVPGVLDLLKDLRCRQVGDPSRSACGFC